MSVVLEALARHAAARPEHPAVTGQGVRLTWSGLADAVETARGDLAAALEGLPADAPVGVALDNGPAWVVVDLALVALGRPSVPLPPFFTPEQRRHALTDAGACLLVSSPATTDSPIAVVAGVPVGGERLPARRVTLHPGTAKITYTSGSTGAPKGVCLSQAQMEAVACSLVEVIGAEFADRHMPVLPLGVLLENVAGLYATLIAGGCYHALGLETLGFGEGLRPDLRRLVDAIEAESATSLILVPELLRALTLALALSGRRLPALRLVAVGGAKVSPDLIAMARAVGLPAYEGYGLSECASVVALNTPAADRPGSVGRILPHLQVALAGDGEVIVGPRPFLGYVGGPPQTGAAPTGDLAEMDADGWLRIHGRKSNLLITAYGRNVAPEWVESELLAQPEIAQAIVFGEGAPELCAVLVPIRADLPPDAIAGAVARANARLPAYARIGRWTERPPFDRARGELTGNGRPRRDVLRETHRSFVELQI